MNHITLTEDGMKLLVRVMRRADWMLSVSGALEANRIVNDVFVLPTDEQKEQVLMVLDWLVGIGDLHYANNVHDVPPIERFIVTGKHH